jgi:tetratricopeptide (TPR) repeat protein
VVLTVALAGTMAGASEPDRGADPASSASPTRPASATGGAAVVLQKNPDFALWDAEKKLAPPRPGLLYRMERADGPRVLLAAAGEGLRGWTFSGSVIPLDQADSYFSSVIRIRPRDPFAYLMRAVVRRENGDLDPALADVEEALRLDPKSGAAWIERARLWRAKNQAERALADVDRALEIDPADPAAFVEQGLIAYSRKEFEKCRKDFDRAAALGSRAVIVDILRGRMDLEKKDLKKAHGDFVRALQADPARHDAYLGLASTYLMSGQPRVAQMVLDQAVQADPANPEAYVNRAVYFLNRGDYEKALFNLEEVIRLAPTSPKAHQERAWLLATCPVARLRDGPQAVASATRACELTDWKQPRCLATLAAACAEAGDFEAAVRWQEQAIVSLGDRAPEKRGAREALDRYMARKPYHSLGLLEEIGIRSYHTPSK